MSVPIKYSPAQCRMNQRRNRDLVHYQVYPNIEILSDTKVDRKSSGSHIKSIYAGEEVSM